MPKTKVEAACRRKSATKFDLPRDLSRPHEAHAAFVPPFCSRALLAPPSAAPQLFQVVRRSLCLPPPIQFVVFFFVVDHDCRKDASSSQRGQTSCHQSRFQNVRYTSSCAYDAC